MSAFEQYREGIAREHCPTIGQLAHLTGRPVADVLAVMRDLWERSELCGITAQDQQDDGTWVFAATAEDDIAAEDVSVICEALDSRDP